MSLSSMKVTRSVVVAIIAVSLFASGIYYAVPDNHAPRSIAFALGPGQYPSMNAVNSTVLSLVTWINVTFQNGTVWMSYYPEASSAGLNSTDIKEIQIFPFPAYLGGFDLPEPWLAMLQYAMDWKIQTGLAANKTEDLGVLDVKNYTFSFFSSADMRIPPNRSASVLNYTLQVDSTGYWDLGTLPYGPWNWHIRSSQFKDILPDTSEPVNMSFDLDLSVLLYYQVTTQDVTQTGSATVQWAGRWGTVQLLHDGDKLLGFQYSFSDVSLKMVSK